MGILIPAVVIGLFSGGVTLFGLGYLGMYIRLKRSHPDDALQRISASTVVELEGTARTHQTLYAAPFTQTDCLLQQWSIEEASPTTVEEGTPWTQLASGDAQTPFRLETTAGTVLVDPEGASFALRPSTAIPVDGGEAPPPTVERFLNRIDSIDRIGSFQRRYREWRLDPDRPVHVLGPLRAPDPSFDPPTGIDAVVGLSSSQNGRLSVGGHAFRMVAHQLMPGTTPFLISNTDKAGTERKMLRSALLLLLLGLPFNAFAVVLVLI